jgi:hypothetical protein
MYRVSEKRLSIFNFLDSAGRKTKNQNIKFSKKRMFCTFKVERSQKFVLGLPKKIHSESLKNNWTLIKFKKP